MEDHPITVYDSPLCAFALQIAAPDKASEAFHDGKAMERERARERGLLHGPVSDGVQIGHQRQVDLPVDRLKGGILTYVSEGKHHGLRHPFPTHAERRGVSRAIG